MIDLNKIIDDLSAHDALQKWQDKFPIADYTVTEQGHFGWRVHLLVDIVGRGDTLAEATREALEEAGEGKKTKNTRAKRKTTKKKKQK